MLRFISRSFRMSLNLACVSIVGLSSCDAETLADLMSELKKLKPSPRPSLTPSPLPTSAPTTVPSTQPTVASTPSSLPSTQPTPLPSLQPTAAPTPYPTAKPTKSPKPYPTSKPTTTPTTTPTPTPLPTAQPTPTPVPTPQPTPVVTPTPAPTGTPGTTQPELGLNASLNGRLPFPANNAWNTPIDQEPVDPNSDTLISSIGLSTRLHPDFGANWNGGPFGFPYLVVSGSTPKVPITFTDYGDESDPGPYPIPPNAPIEGGANSTGDRHVLVVDKDNWKLYELYNTYPNTNGYSASSGAVWDLNTNATRPAGWTSADAAGLPIFPGLVRYDEVAEQQEIRHALRFTASRTRRAYVAPASHFASSNTSPNLPPMGMRVRLKANFNITTYPPRVQVILKALKKYGMILADNGSNWFISGVADSRWNDSEMNTLKTVAGSNFEVVKMGTVVTQ